MYYEIDLSALPEVTGIYSVVRRTVWKIVDPDTLLIFAAEGRCLISTDNREHILEKGGLFIVPGGHFYVRRPIENEFCTLYYMHLRFAAGCSFTSAPMDVGSASERMSDLSDEPTFSKWGRMESKHPHVYVVSELTDLSASRDEVISMMDEARREALDARIDSITKSALIAERLLLLAAEETGRQLPSEEKRLPQASKMLNYISLHAKDRDGITLDDLCAVSNFSKQHLIRIFRKEYGKTPKAYICEYRINCAKELFYRNPRLSVKEVAEEMGFEDQHYFTRLFTNLTGMTPTDYKKHLINFDPSSQ